MKRSVFIILLILIGGKSVGQILNDSLQSVYGPRLTFYTKESDLRYNEPTFRQIDTTIYNSYRKNKVEQVVYFNQNLGLAGTALRPIFYEKPKNQGVNTGFNSFEPYYTGPEDVRYYNTRAPYSRLGAFLGGGNRAMTDVEFSRSDSINFNFGFNFRNFGIDKQIERNGRGDRRVESTFYDVYANIRSSNLRYQAMLNFTRIRHQQIESGGIDTTGVGIDTTSIEDFFKDDVGVFLRNATSDERRLGLHLYHQYQVLDWLEIYNTLESHSQSNEYISDPIGTDADYYDNFFLSTTTTLDSVDYKYRLYDIGVKGRVGKLYYNTWYKQKDYDFYYKYFEEDSIILDSAQFAMDSIYFNFDSLVDNPSGTERYLGVQLGYYFTKDLRLRASYERLDSTNYELTALLEGPNFKANYHSGLYKPSFLSQAYIGNHRIWVNDFRNTLSQGFTGEYSIKLKKATITPIFSYDQVKRQVYWGLDTLPAQNSRYAIIESLGLKWEIELGKRFVVDGQLRFTELNDVAETTMAVPEQFFYARFYYRNQLFRQALESVIGVDVSYKSDYYAPAYDPVVQQYYLQDREIIEGYPIINVFTNFKINRANIFLRYNNIWATIKDYGYFVAPLYIGLQPTLDFGFTWWFFD